MSQTLAPGTTNLAQIVTVIRQLAQAAQSLADVSNAATARTNLGFTSALVDRAYAEYTTNATLTTRIPFDDTIPQVTEGTQVLSASITPKTTTNRVRVTVTGNAITTAADATTVAVFRNGGANAIAAKAFTTAGLVEVNLIFEDVPASTSAQTYTVRVGAGSNDAAMNGTVSPLARYLGGSSRAVLLLEEFTA